MSAVGEAVPARPAGFQAPRSVKRVGDLVRGRRFAAHPAWLVVGLPVVWNLINLRAETLPVSYLNDSSVHEQMVRFATARFSAGHLPLTSWFPYLGLGSPQFLHYQSLPAMLTGLAGLVVGPNAAFGWSLYILLSAWPISIYLAARLFGIDRWAAAASALMSPFLMTATGVGYEQRAYVWIGYGVWAQLWASLTLPLAWGATWSAVRDGRRYLPAVGLISLTIALHYETGYLAILPLLLWPMISRKALRRRVGRAAVLAGGVLLVSAWVIVPLIDQRSWAATNEVLRHTPFVNGYGAGQILSWLVTGQLLDAGRVPVITLFAVIGLAAACHQWRKDESSRALLVVFGGCLILSFGRAGLGSVVDIIPGSQDLFFRRFMMGVELAALLLAGIGAARCWGATWSGIQRMLSSRGARWRRRRVDSCISGGAACMAAVAVLAPAWSQLLALDHRNAMAIETQQRADSVSGGEVNRLVDVAQREGRGRIYAGTPSNWGMDFTVGAVPVFKYLESLDADQVGYTLRTASLMSGPEYYFDERNLSDYVLFGIRYLILRAGWRSPVAAQLRVCAGSYCLWRLPSSGYVHVGSTFGTLTADRTDLGSRSIRLLRSLLAGDGRYLRVAFGSEIPVRQPLSSLSSRPVGRVLSERSELVRGEAQATVKLVRPGVVVLSSSFDPGWRVSVDGHKEIPQMLAPALVGVNVPAGTHKVMFSYGGYQQYPMLLSICGVSILALLLVDVKRKRRDKES
jgi:hypothetical protein